MGGAYAQYGGTTGDCHNLSKNNIKKRGFRPARSTKRKPVDSGCGATRLRQKHDETLRLMLSCGHLIVMVTYIRFTLHRFNN
jgi:hypothetical protein